MKKMIFSLLVSSISCICIGQFHPISSEGFYNGGESYLGNGLSLADFDRDGLDDITICDKGIGVNVFRNVGKDSFELIHSFLDGGDPKMPSWVDYDNDGDSDLFYTCSHCLNQLHRNDGGGIFTNVSDSLNPSHSIGDSQGCSWGDYDQDGYLDLYVCNYDFEIIKNWLYHNNGDGTFTELAEALGVDNGSNATFQSVWTDINLDGLQDLYVVNDKLNINRMFTNSGDEFEMTPDSIGLSVTMNSMCNSISDYDRDGDFDIYISNTAYGNQFLRNNNGVFEDIASQTSTALHSHAWGSLWIDCDLDGDDDLHVSTTTGNPLTEQNYFFINNGAYDFDPLNGQGLLGDLFVSYASAKFDSNNDGKIDFAVTNQNPNELIIWQNDSEDTNHFVKFGLHGELSNRDGIGSVIRIYHEGAQNLLQTYCGENYLSQDSQYEIIGLGDATMVDSLIIHWPLGWVDKYYNLGGDQFYSFTEGETYLCEITSSAGNQLCTAGGSLTLSAGEHLSYLWSDASTSLSLDVNAAGIYEVTVTNEYGLQATATFEVVYYDELEVEISTQQPLCAASSDGTISIIADDEQVTNILWSNEQSGLQLQNLSQGEYTYQLTDMNGCEYENTIILADPAPVVASVTAENILCNGGTTVLSAAASGGTGAYTLQWSLSDPTQAPAGEHSLTVTDANGCSALHIITLDEPSLIVIDNNTQAVCNGEYTAADVSTTGGTGALQQNWNGVDETQLFAGDYSLTVTDANGCATTSVITIVEYAALAVTTTITDANEGNNGSILLGVTGGVEPYTFYWSNGATGNPLEAIGQGIYTCTITDGAGCYIFTELFTMIDIGISESYGTKNIDFVLYSNGHWIAKNDLKQVGLFNSSGQLLLSFNDIRMGNVFPIGSLASGYYFLVSQKGAQKITQP